MHGIDITARRGSGTLGVGGGHVLGRKERRTGVRVQENSVAGGTFGEQKRIKLISSIIERHVPLTLARTRAKR